ncbi:MAG TPA: hypothetical protein VGK71_09495 [Nitrospirota bacterium]|jgi:transposase-like protein
MNIKFKFTCNLCKRSSQIVEKDLKRFEQMEGSFILYYKCPKCHKESGQIFPNSAIEKIDNFDILLLKMRDGNSIIIE